MDQQLKIVVSSSTENNDKPKGVVAKSLLGADLAAPKAPPIPLGGKKRFQVSPGKSMVEWMKISKEEGSSRSSGATPSHLRKIGRDELASHNTLNDCWMAINDKVYNVSKYMEYHPGGVVELMKGAGQDGTTLFNQVHRWVNYENILRSQFLGYLVGEGTLKNSIVTPTWKFTEDEDSLFLQIDSHVDEDIVEESWTVGLLNREKLLLKLILKPPKVWITHLRLIQKLVDDKLNVEYQNNFKKMLITLRKPKKERWLSLGAPLSNDNKLVDSRLPSLLEDEMYPVELCRKKQLTHNTYLFTATSLPSHGSISLGVPLGFHLQLRLSSTTRPYTPVCLSMGEEPQRSREPQQQQQFHFIIKLYPEGELTSKLMQEQEEFQAYLGCPGGSFSFSTFFQDSCPYLILLAGGTGITPFIRIVQHLLHKKRGALHPHCPKVLLIFFNQEAQDILLRDEWERLGRDEGWFNFYPVITCDKEESGGGGEHWEGKRGRISKPLFEECVLESGVRVVEGRKMKAKAMVCGSYGFNSSCKEVLVEQELLLFEEPSGIFLFNG